MGKKVKSKSVKSKKKISKDINKNSKVKNKKTKSVMASKKLKSKTEDRILTADVAFYCCNGSVFYCLADLYAGLIIMDDNAFRFHVNNEKNDFYNWILNIFKDEELANKVKNVKSSSVLKKIIQRALC